MEEPVYQLLHEGRTAGPYDRRTIVGMRIRKALASESELIASDGSRLTVADLLRLRPAPGFQPNRTTSYSLVQATYSASLEHAQRGTYDIPDFKGEIEARVQTDVLRLAGRFRKGFGWKEDRVKVPLRDIAHARVRASTVDLWLGGRDGAKLQRITLELFTPEAAGEFVEWLPSATPWPEADSQPAPLSAQGAGPAWMWAAVIGTAVTVGIVLLTLLSRRLY